MLALPFVEGVLLTHQVRWQHWMRNEFLRGKVTHLTLCTPSPYLSLVPV